MAIPREYLAPPSEMLEEYPTTKPLISPENKTELIGEFVFMISSIANNFPDELPDIIFPEFTGRLLYQPTLSLLTRIANMRNVGRPKGYAFLTASALKNDGQGPLRQAKRFYVQQEKEAEKIQQQRQLEGRDFKPLIMIDDTIGQRGTTLGQVRAAFHDQTIQGYALYGGFIDILSLPEGVVVGKKCGDLPDGMTSPFHSITYDVLHYIAGARKRIHEEEVSVDAYDPSENKKILFLQELFQKEMASITKEVAQRLGL